MFLTNEQIAKLKAGEEIELDMPSRTYPRAVVACIKDDLARAGLNCAGLTCYTINNQRSLVVYWKN